MNTTYLNNNRLLNLCKNHLYNELLNYRGAFELIINSKI